MSVLIRGMKLPDKPRNCRFYDIDPMGIRKPYCSVQAVCNGLKDCPLVEIPEPHGRLIDADALVDCLATLLQFPSNLVNGQWIVNTLREQPTIIPAEEGSR